MTTQTVKSTSAMRPLRGDNMDAEDLSSALKDLPVEMQDAVTQRLAEAVVEYDSTNRTASLKRFAHSVLITARLHRNPKFVKSLNEANDDLAAEMAAARPLQDLIAETKEKYDR